VKSPSSTVPLPELASGGGESRQLPTKTVWANLF